MYSKLESYSLLLLLSLFLYFRHGYGRLACGVKDPEDGDRSEVPDNLRKASRPISYYSTGTTNVLVIRGVMKGESVDGLQSNQQVLETMNSIGDFFDENSGGKQKYTFTIYNNGFTEYPGYTESNCASQATCPQIARLSSQIEQNNSFSNYDRFLYVYEHGCRCFGWAGLGQVPGKVSWSNGKPNLRVVGHELGHNNGAYHSNRAEREYANDFSIMGGSSYTLHFTAAGKVAMQWIDEVSQVKTLARSGQCFNFDPCVESCTKDNPCTYDLYAHDQGTYVENRVYAVRILTEEHYNENLWIEYRLSYPQNYADSVNGVILIWSIKRGSTVYGPTHLEDYDSLSGTQKDAYLPLGKTWVYDFDHVGAVITPVRKNQNSMSVSIYFTDQVASSTNSIQTGALFRGNEDPILGCGEQDRRVIIKGTEDYKVFETRAEAESTISITVKKLNCSAFQLENDKAGIYVYPTYPLQLELNSEAELGNGAIHFSRFECFDEEEDDLSTTSTFELKAVTTPSSLPGYEILSFTQANYIAFFTGLDQDVEVTVSLSESDTCYSPCEVIYVNGSTPSINGNYSLDNYTFDADRNISWPVFVKDEFSLTMDISAGRWKLLDDDENLIAEQQLLPRPQYPHVVNSWSNGITTVCMQRPSRNKLALGPLNENAFFVYFIIGIGGLIILIALYMPMKAYSLKKKYKKESTVVVQDTGGSKTEVLSKPRKVNTNRTKLWRFTQLIAYGKTKKKAASSSYDIQGVTKGSDTDIENCSSYYDGLDRESGEYMEASPKRALKFSPSHLGFSAGLKSQKNDPFSPWEPNATTNFGPPPIPPNTRASSVEPSGKSSSIFHPTFKERPPRRSGPFDNAAIQNSVNKGRCTCEGCKNWAFENNLCRKHLKLRNVI